MTRTYESVYRSWQDDPEAFWAGLAAILRDLGPRHDALLVERDRLQSKIDDWHRENPGPVDLDRYAAFLTAIGYLREEPDGVRVDLTAVDPSLAVAAPQLVVPADNARYALNAANARWGSLYDALYGTDVIPESDGQERGKSYNPVRGAAVVRYAAEFLDRTIPLEAGSHGDVANYALQEDGGRTNCVATLANGDSSALRDPGHFVGFAADGSSSSYLFRRTSEGSFT